MKKMKGKVVLILITVMFISMFSGCKQNGTELPDSSKTTGNIIDKSTIYAGTGYESTDNPTVKAYISDPPPEFPVTSIPDTLTVGSYGEPDTLHPYASSAMPSNIAINPLYETLVRYNPFTQEYEGNLAEDWEFIDDETLRMYLRKDVVCHAGYDFTASDVLWSAQQGKASPISNYLWKVFDVDNFEIIDDYTIDIKTYGAFGPIFAYLSDTCAGYIVDQQAYEAQNPDDYARNPDGGHGPYKFVDWIAGDSITYEVFDDYFAEKPYFRNLIIRNISDDVTRALSLESGDLDMIYNVDYASAQMIIDSPLANLITTPSYQLIHLGYDLEKEPFNNPLVRKALRHALDLEHIVDIAFHGMAEVADGPWPNSLTAYKPNTNPDTAYEYDVEKAKALLEEAGYADGFEFELWVEDTTSWMQMAEMIQNAYAEIGIIANVKVMDTNTLISQRAEGKHEAYIARFSCSGDDASLWDFRFKTDIGCVNNPAQYKNPRADEIFEQAANSIDEDYRQELYFEFVDIFREDLVWQSLANPLMCYGIRSTLKGVAPHPYGTSDLRYIRPINVD